MGNQLDRASHDLRQRHLTLSGNALGLSIQLIGQLNLCSNHNK